MEKSRNRITRFLLFSMVLLSVFCIIVFSVQASWNSTMGASAINDIGIIYMSGISEQVAAHFGTTMELRLSQVSELVDAVPPSRAMEADAMRVSLAYIARSRGFEYLSLYTEDDQFEMIYGPQLDLRLAESFYTSLHRGEEQVGAGFDVSGADVVMMSVPAAYPLKNGRESIALVAGLPTEYLHNTLTVDEHAMADYSIIRRDGSFIIRGSGMEDAANYFDQVRFLCQTEDGRDPEPFVAGLREAMKAGRDYTGQLQASGTRWHVYCSPLPESGWYLSLHMPYSTLDETVARLGTRWTAISLGGCVLVLGLLLLVFYHYFRMTRRQIRELDDARRSADKARKSAERASQVKSEFLSNMSHDIRTPMNGIMGMTTVAMANLDNAQQVRSCLKKINISSRHLLGLLNDMLDMSKIERGELGINAEPVSLREIVANTQPMIQPQILDKKQHFNIYTRNIPHENVVSDTVRLTQILLNLLGNAVKFTPEGGDIQLLLFQEPSPRGDTYIRTHIEVRDNGVGMDPELQERIFEAFVREDAARVKKAAGSGLGLTITKHIVDAMQGSITVESAPGQGSAFHVTLDLEKVYSQEIEQPLAEWSVLVVDSDEQLRESVVEMLASIGLRADGVKNAAQGLELARRGNYQIVLLDWNLPEEACIQAAQLLGQKGRPLLALYDGDWSDAEAAAQAAGVEGCIARPLFRSTLYYGLRKYTQGGVAQESEPEDELADFTGRRVLLAEDNELNYEIASELLQELGVEVDWAENGQICVEKFMSSTENWYDLILMDLRMPLMTGFEAAWTIRSMSNERADAATVPIIAVSADAFYDDIQRCLDSGMDAHTPKPMDLGEISWLMDKYINRQR